MQRQVKTSSLHVVTKARPVLKQTNYNQLEKENENAGAKMPAEIKRRENAGGN